MNDKVKILFWADQVVPTGFARVAHSIIENLPENFDVCAIGINYYGDPHEYKHRIYPAPLGGDIYGIRRLDNILAAEKPDIIYLINDAWVLNPMLDAIKKFYADKTLPKIFTYIPVDAKDHDPEWYNHFDIVTKVVAYTEFGKDVILTACPPIAEKICVIPHGIDNKSFYKIEGPKQDIKRLLYPNRDDFLHSFVVLNANRNQPRKRIDLTMEAFKLFAENKPENVKLYLHMGMTDSHIHLQKMARRLGIEERLILTSAKGGVQTVPTSQLNLIYNATDVGVNTCVGEGFGLINIEHTVTGAPQVVPDHSSTKELYFDCGMLVPARTKFTLDNIMTTGYLVDPKDVAARLELLYFNKDLYQRLSEASIKKFTSSTYSWKAITSLWTNLFLED